MFCQAPLGDKEEVGDDNATNRNLSLVLDMKVEASVKQLLSLKDIIVESQQNLTSVKDHLSNVFYEVQAGIPLEEVLPIVTVEYMQVHEQIGRLAKLEKVSSNLHHLIPLAV